MPRKVTQKRKFKGGSSNPKKATRATSRKRTASPISLVLAAPQTIFKKANQKVEGTYEDELSQECLNILEIQRQTTLDFLKDLEDKLQQLEVNKIIEVRDLKNIIVVNKTFVKESTKRKKESKPAELALKISEYIGEKINYGPVMKVIRKFLREQGEPLQRGLYRNSQAKAVNPYESKPPVANDLNTDGVNAMGRPLFLSQMGAYANQTPIKPNARNPRRKLDLSSTPYENANV